MAASVSGSEVSEGPVLSLISKKLRALKKKYNRIVQTEERQAQGKPLNKEQEEVLRSKPVIAALIDEYEKLRQPIAAAVQEELSRLSSPPPPPTVNEREEEDKASSSGGDVGLLDLVGLLYFSCLFDVKPQGEYTTMMLARAHEKLCCLTYDYVRDDDAPDDMLSERDIDLIAALGGMITSKPVYSGVSHKNALEGCIQHARLWLQKSDLPIHPESSVTYKGLRAKVNKIMASDYFTATPEMKVTDMAAEMEKYNNTACQAQFEEAGVVPTHDDVHDSVIEYSENKEDEQEQLHAETSINESSTLDETQTDESSTVLPSGDYTTDPQVEETVDEVVDHNQDFEYKGQHQYAPRRGGYPNPRGGRGGRRGFSNGRGARGIRGGGRNGYENGRGQQYFDSGYYPRNYYNSRGRGGGRSGGSAAYGNNNHGAPAAQEGHVAVGASN